MGKFKSGRQFSVTEIYDLTRSKAMLSMHLSLREQFVMLPCLDL